MWVITNQVTHGYACMHLTNLASPNTHLVPLHLCVPIPSRSKSLLLDIVTYLFQHLH